MSHFESCVERFRIAPFGRTMAMAAGSLAIACAGIAADAFPEHSELGFTYAGLSCLAAATGVTSQRRLVGMQIRLEERLSSHLQEYGFDERVFAVTTNEWCNRQTARVVCEKYGADEDYEKLCDERTMTAQLRFIPHI